MTRVSRRARHFGWLLGVSLMGAAGAGEWQVRGEIPYHVYGHMAAALGSRLHYRCGCHTPDYQVLTDAHQVDDLSSSSWSTAARLPLGLGWSVPALYKDKIYCKPCLPIWSRAVAADGDRAPAPAIAREFAWTCGPELIAPVARPEDPYHAIKDPTVVNVDGRWHVYATIKCKDRTVMECLSFTDWKDAHAAPRHPIELVKAYHCAPQLFHFGPKRAWYLIYQWGDDSRKYFGPCFSTLEHPGKPETLTRPVMLYPEKPANVNAWLDFWVIGDPEGAKVHLFFTSLDGKMWRAETTYAAFPHGWSRPEIVLTGDIFEASHTYRLKGTAKFLTIIEAQASGGRRYYKAYLADRLDGKWTPLADSLEKPFAGERNVRFAEGVKPWTDSISHGELLREGCDETMTVDPGNIRFLFQGCSAEGRAGKGYGGFTWRLGILSAN